MASTDFETEKIAFKEFYASNQVRLRDAADSFRTLVQLLLSDRDEFSSPVVTSRVKERDECISKFMRKYQKSCEETKTPYEIQGYITDLIGIRAVCLYETDICLAQNVIVDNFEVINITNKSQLREQHDDSFGYKGLHLDLKLKLPRRDMPEYRQFTDLKFELQLRTIIQDAWSTLDHKIKYKKTIPAKLKRRINRLAALFELSDQEFLNISAETKKLQEEANQSMPGEEALLFRVSGSLSQPLTAFEFTAIVRGLFPGYPFNSDKVDEFVEELLEMSPTMTSAQLKNIVSRHSAVVKKYKEYEMERYHTKLNPYTTIRHMLFLEDKEQYSRVLFDFARTHFETWLKEQS